LRDPWLDGLADSIWSKPAFSMVPIDYETVPKEPYAGPGLDEQGPRIVFFGIPSDYGTAFLLHLIEKRANLAAVVCSTRWQRTHPKADLISRIAGHLGRPVEVASNVNAQAFTRCLKAYEPDVVVMASFDQIVGAETLEVPRRGWLNIHPSLLPRHRGPEPIYWTIVKGDRTAGISVHLTVPKIDAGPILAQRQIEVRPNDTSGTLCKRLVAEGLGALDDTLVRLSTGNANVAAPDLATGSYEPPVHQPAVEWDQPFERLDRLVRAGDPDQPPSFPYRGRRRFVRAVRRVRPRRGERLGVLEALPPDEMLAAVADAVVALRWRQVGHTHALRPLPRQQFP
jgi:methionyl-tRNA formyltransferase